MSLIRYPGSKTKLIDDIIKAFPDEFLVPLFVSDSVHYIEPFFGSGAIGFAVMSRMHRGARVTISDADGGIVALWRAVWKQPRDLCRLIVNYVPSVESFYELKSRDGEYTDDVDTGFRKLALHRISVSGFGYMAGGPIGGRGQGGNYTVECRWKPERMSRVIKDLHRLLSKFQKMEIEQRCVFHAIENAERDAPLHSQSFMYLDPPYFEKGNQLYKYGFSDSDHRRLANTLRHCRFGWAVSYDDHPTIRDLYSWAGSTRLEVTYSNAVCTEPTRRKNSEILITPQRDYQLNIA